MAKKRSAQIQNYTVKGLVFLLLHPSRMNDALAEMSSAAIELHLKTTHDEINALQVEVNLAVAAYLEKNIGISPGWKERQELGIANRRLLTERLSRELHERSAREYRRRFGLDRVRTIDEVQA